MEAIIQNMSVAGLMEATGSLDDSDELVRALLYGVEGVHYAVGTEGEIEMLRVGIAVYGGAAYDRGGNLLPGAVERRKAAISTRTATRCTGSKGNRKKA